MKFSTLAPFVAALAGIGEAAANKPAQPPLAPLGLNHAQPRAAAPKGPKARDLLDLDLGATVNAAVGTVAGVAASADVSADVSASVAGVASVSASADVNATAFVLAKTYDQATLFQGLAPAAISGDADVNLYLGLPAASIQGTVDVSLGADISITPTIRIDLGGLVANVELEVSADAKIFETIELTSILGLDLAVPGLAEVTAGVGLALDLIVSVGAAVDLTAGFALSFPTGSFVEIDILTSTVVDHDLSGLVANMLPVAVGVDVDLSVDIEIEIGLRLRTEVAISAEVGLLGLEILGAGAEVAIWINLFDYTAILIGESTSTGCSSTGLITENFCLNVGIIVDADIEVLDVLDIELDLAPTVSVNLAIGPTASCVAVSTATGLYQITTATATGTDFTTGTATGTGASKSIPTASITGASSSVPIAIDTGASQSLTVSITGASQSLTATGTGASKSVPSGSVGTGYSTGSGSNSATGASKSGSNSATGASKSVPAGTGSGYLSGSGSVGTGYPTGSGSNSATGASKSGSNSATGASKSAPAGTGSGYLSGSGSVGSGYPTGSGSGSAYITGTSASAAITGGSTGTGSGNSGSVITSAPASSQSISTFYETTVVTITSCAASVVNCPATYTQKVVTAIVYSRTTVCGATMIPSTSATATAGSSVPLTTYPASSLPPASTLTVAPSVETAVIVPTVVMSEKTTVCAGTSILATTAPSGTYIIKTEAPSASTKPAVSTGTIIQPSYTFVNGSQPSGTTGYAFSTGFPPSSLTTSCKPTTTPTTVPVVEVSTSATSPVGATTVPGVASTTGSHSKTTTSGYTIVTAGADRTKAQFGAFAAVMAGAAFVL